LHSALGGHGTPRIAFTDNLPHASSVKPAEALVFIGLLRDTQAQDSVDESSLFYRTVISSHPIREKLSEPPPRLDLSVPSVGEEGSASEHASAGDGNDQAQLFGFYTGQIHARIDRLWLRPRSRVDDSSTHESDPTDRSFQCQVQIDQDEIGNVREVLLLECNGTLAWQQSLVSAIRQSSPLPSPPSQKVFRHSISLHFVGVEYAPGVADDLYDSR
jgi:hypothetical protein